MTKSQLAYLSGITFVSIGLIPTARSIFSVKSFNNFLKQIDSTLHKQYTLEKFKEGYTGKGFVVEEPKFEFKKPTFKKDLDLPKASEVPVAKEYLEKRKLDPTQFYFTPKFMEWVNTQKQTFDTIFWAMTAIILEHILANFGLDWGWFRVVLVWILLLE